MGRRIDKLFSESKFSKAFMLMRSAFRMPSIDGETAAITSRLPD